MKRLSTLEKRCLSVEDIAISLWLNLLNRTPSLIDEIFEK